MSNQKITSTRRDCPGNFCFEKGIVEFAGFCARCWVEMTPEERAIAKGDEPPVKEIVEHRVEIHRARSLTLTMLIWIWAIVMTALVVWLAVKK